MNTYKTIQVFGVSNDNIKSYIERDKVDSLFQRGLLTNKHIIIFGSSKQGKTALTNRYLIEDSFIRVNCSPETKPVDIYKSILRELKIQFEVESTKTETVESSLSVGIKAKVMIPFISGDTNVGGEAKGSNGAETMHRCIEYNLELPQDISEILKGISFKKRIVVENFHYLSEEVQKRLAHHLRVFEDNNILFIILGIWREKNRLTQFNGDLQDRLIEIPVEPWLKDDFGKIVKLGAPLLNVNFDGIFNELVKLSFDSVGVFQELCKEVCLSAEINETVVKEAVLNQDHLEKAKKKKMEDYEGRHIRSIETFIEQRGKSSEKTPLYLAYYFIKFLFEQNFEEIVGGLKRNQIRDGIKNIHHRNKDVRPSDMSSFLHNIVSSQIKKGITPPLFDYDRSIRTLKIIDSTFYFFIRNANLGEIFESFNSPEGI